MKKCEEPIWYHDRKNGIGADCPLQIKKMRNKTAYIKSVFKSRTTGREYIANDETFQTLESLMTRVRQTTDLMTGQDVRKSYIYIISKKIADQTYYKLGLSDKSGLTRITGAQTFLIPGLGDEVGFKVHMIFTYPAQTIGTSEHHVNHYIEKMCHKVLRYYFKGANIKFGNDESSEWYLIPESDGIYFCGFLLDIIASFAYSSESGSASHDLAPHNIWVLDGKKPLRTLKLPPEEDVLKRLRKDDRYDQAMNVFDLYGLRNIRAFSSNTLIEIEIEPSDKLQARGTVDKFQSVLFSDGMILKHPETNEIQGRLFEFMKHTFLLTKIHKNTFKYGVGQPLQSGEIYGLIREYNSEKSAILSKEVSSTEDIPFPRRLFDKKKILVIPNTPTESGIFVEFYVSIGFLLEWLKPTNEEAMKSWPLYRNYEYYRDRKVKTTKTYVMNDNFVVPQWYFHKGVQEYFAKYFVSKGDKWEHQDTDLKNEDQIVYTWTLTGQTILKEELHETPEKNKIRSAYFITRSRPQGNQEITEEVPVVRLMHVLKVNESDMDPTNAQSKFVTTRKPSNRQLKLNDTLIVQENNHLKIPKGLLTQNIENDVFDETMVVFLLRDIYTKRVPSIRSDDDDGNGNETEAEISFVKGMIKWPSEDASDKRYEITVDDLKKNTDKIVKIEPPKLKVNTILRAKPKDLSGFGENFTDENEYHYCIIRDVRVEYDFWYIIQYFPPFDKIEPWPIPEEDTEALKRGKHSNPRNIKTEPWERALLERSIEKSVVQKVNMESETHKSELNEYKKNLKTFEQPIEKILSHYPSNALSKDDVKEYMVLFENKSKGKLKWEHVDYDSENKYWGITKSRSQTKSQTRSKSRSRSKSQTRKSVQEKERQKSIGSRTRSKTKKSLEGGRKRMVRTTTKRKKRKQIYVKGSSLRSQKCSV